MLLLPKVAPGGPWQTIEDGQELEGLLVGQPERALDRGVGERAVVDPAGEYTWVFSDDDDGPVGYFVEDLNPTIRNIYGEVASTCVYTQEDRLSGDVGFRVAALCHIDRELFHGLDRLAEDRKLGCVDFDLGRHRAREVELGGEERLLVAQVVGDFGHGHPEDVAGAAVADIFEHEFQVSALHEDARADQTFGGDEARGQEAGDGGVDRDVDVAARKRGIADEARGGEDRDRRGLGQDALLRQFDLHHLGEVAVRAMPGVGRQGHVAALRALCRDEPTVAQGQHEAGVLPIGLLVEGGHLGGELQVGATVAAFEFAELAVEVVVGGEDGRGGSGSHGILLHSPSSRTMAPP